ncbi:CMRF35-like molecule 1 [Lepus europaeus]|uniref:CMRF35-like molecule 1 n=1 Tax=Lepus europaeus TaxID=9983 RepID=UPI002B45D7C3|nr:CMRF35-like molecule 1 [Lepus europaeus]
MHLLLLIPLLFWLSGSSAAEEPVSSLTTVSSPEQGLLSVKCHYAPGWERYKKYWCQGAIWSSCEILVITDGSEREAKKGRVAIRDDQRSRVFTVTMQQLSQGDTDIYWCAIERVLADPKFRVAVTVGPAPGAFTATMATFTAPATREKTEGSPTVSSHHSGTRAPSDSQNAFLAFILHPLTLPTTLPKMKLSTLLPLLFAVLLLLLMVASLLAWRMMKRQNKAAGTRPEQALQSLESDLCYVNLTLPQTGSSPGSSQSKAPRRSASAQAGQEEVEYVTMAPVPRGEISYASLSLGILDQEPTYSNASHFIRHGAGRGHEESTEYSIIRKP